MTEPIRALIERWKHDPGSTYSTWFLWDERLKNFRSIRRGIARVVEDLEAGSFGNAYRGSSLETVVGSVAEQRDAIARFGAGLKPMLAISSAID
jgi:type II restriction enzyme